MANLPDFSKLTANMGGLQKIMQNVKAMVGAEPSASIEEKNDPIGYKLGEITKSLKIIQECSLLQQKEIEKIGVVLGALHKEFSATIEARKTQVTPIQPVASESAPVTTSSSTSEEVVSSAKTNEVKEIAKDETKPSE